MPGFLTKLVHELLLSCSNKVTVVKVRKGSLPALAESISTPEGLLVVLIVVLVLVLGLPHPEAIVYAIIFDHPAGLADLRDVSTFTATDSSTVAGAITLDIQWYSPTQPPDILLLECHTHVVSVWDRILKAQAVVTISIILQEEERNMKVIV